MINILVVDFTEKLQKPMNSGHKRTQAMKALKID